jgi:hypothetical protein
MTPWRFRFASLIFCLTGLLLCLEIGRAEDAPLTTPGAASSLMTPKTQRELFDALDLSGDALQPVREAVAKGDYAAADHALAQYYRNRTSVPWTFDPHHPQRDAAFKDPVAEDAVMKPPQLTIKQVADLKALATGAPESESDIVIGVDGKFEQHFPTRANDVILVTLRRK